MWSGAAGLILLPRRSRNAADHPTLLTAEVAVGRGRAFRAILDGPEHPDRAVTLAGVEDLDVLEHGKLDSGVPCMVQERWVGC